MTARKVFMYGLAALTIGATLGMAIGVLREWTDVVHR